MNLQKNSSLSNRLEPRGRYAYVCNYPHTIVFPSSNFQFTMNRQTKWWCHG